MIAVSTIARLTFADNVESLRRVELRYDPADPYAVTLHLDDGVDWTFARDLLDDGLHFPAGLGDVLVWQQAGHAKVRLYGDIGWVLLSLDLRDMEFFLHLTYAAVPRGAEDVEHALDRWLAALLHTEPTT